MLPITEVERIRQEYPVGTRIKLLKMDDPHPLLPGSYGTVDRIDDAGTIFVHWDNGRRLGVIPGEDKFEIIAQPGDEKEE